MEIEKLKQANTTCLCKNIIYYEEIDSTQDEAKRIINKVKDGTIIIADIQTKGRGTKGRSWYTGSSDNIAVTIILKPKCNIHKLEGFTIKIAEVMKEIIYELYKYNLEIKKPNDLMLNGKKISGILTESSTLNETVNYILIGIGFNVNEMNFTEETKKIATSLKAEYNKDFCKEEILRKFLEKLDEELRRLTL